MPLLNSAGADADAVYLGATPVDAVYLGADKVWPSGPIVYQLTAGSTIRTGIGDRVVLQSQDDNHRSVDPIHTWDPAETLTMATSTDSYTFVAWHSGGTYTIRGDHGARSWVAALADGTAVTLTRAAP
jgi:hypothetical protein